jgi:hypothetical protein
MKYTKEAPFSTVLDGDVIPTHLYRREEGELNPCDCQNDKESCDNSGIYYGTDDEREPKFCARHFFQVVASGNGKTNYKLIEK